MKQNQHCKRGRPVETEQEKMNRNKLKDLFLSNSQEAFETLLDIMRYCLDPSIRLKASTFILNKIVPEGFEVDDKIDNNIIVHVLTEANSNEETLTYEQQETIIREAENEEPWLEDDNNWQTDIYMPKKDK